MKRNFRFLQNKAWLYSLSHQLFAIRANDRVTIDRMVLAKMQPSG